MKLKKKKCRNSGASGHAYKPSFVTEERAYTH